MSSAAPTPLEQQRVRAIRRFRGTCTIREMAREMGLSPGVVQRLVREFSLPFYGDTPGEEVTVVPRNLVRVQALTDAAWRREIDAAKAEAASAPPYKAGALEW